MTNRLTVSVPTYNSPAKKLARAVSSVLYSLPEDGRLVVVNDGGEQPSLWHDHRLTVFDLPENRGRYFADAVVVGTLSDDEYWSPHDADDWSDVGRFAPLLVQAEKAGAVVAPMWRHEINQKPQIQLTNFSKIDSPNVRHLAHWCTGVYSVRRVRLAGGLLLNVRTSYDHCFLMSVARSGTILASKQATYHWERRKDSLTTFRETAIGSKLRSDERKMIDGLWRLILAGENPSEVIGEANGEALNREVEREIGRLSSVL